MPSKEITQLGSYFERIFPRIIDLKKQPPHYKQQTRLVPIRKWEAKKQKSVRYTLKDQASTNSFLDYFNTHHSMLNFIEKLHFQIEPSDQTQRFDTCTLAHRTRINRKKSK